VLEESGRPVPHLLVTHVLIGLLSQISWFLVPGSLDRLQLVSVFNFSSQA
jgi:hypothetical protein